MAKKKIVPPKNQCKHEGEQAWHKEGDRYRPNLNNHGKQILFCRHCPKCGHLDGDKEVWE